MTREQKIDAAVRAALSRHRMRVCNAEAWHAEKIGSGYMPALSWHAGLVREEWRRLAEVWRRQGTARL